MVSQKEQVERVEGGLSEEGTMKIGWVCACTRMFVRDKVGHGCGKTHGFWVTGVMGTGMGSVFGTPRTP